MKAKFKDATVGATLWIKDHGEWKAVTVTKIDAISKSHVIYWNNGDKHGKNAIQTMYAKADSTKAKLKDASLGAKLWIRDHGEWKAVTVTKVSLSDKGIYIHWTDTTGTPGKRSLDTMYAQPQD